MRASIHSSLLLAGLALGTVPVLAQTPAPAAPAPADTSSLSAGGLAPPPALTTTPPPGAAPSTPAATEAELARADKEDSGRGLEFLWLNAEVGVMHLGLGTFKNDELVEPATVDSTQTGLVAGAGVGVRLVFFTLGARFRYAPLPDLKLWTLGAEFGLHAPLGSLEPYASIGLGYVSMGLPDSAQAGGAPKIQGFDGRLAGGLDYYFTNMFSLGVNVGADLLVLARAGDDCVPPQPGATVASTYCSSGSGIGAALTATGVAGLHF
jgi:hypothetical protein